MAQPRALANAVRAGSVRVAGGTMVVSSEFAQNFGASALLDNPESIGNQTRASPVRQGYGLGVLRFFSLGEYVPVEETTVVLIVDSIILQQSHLEWTLPNGTVVVLAPDECMYSRASWWNYGDHRQPLKRVSVLYNGKTAAGIAMLGLAEEPELAATQSSNYNNTVPPESSVLNTITSGLVGNSPAGLPSGIGKTVSALAVIAVVAAAFYFIPRKA